MKSEFGKAQEIYEKIVEVDDTDAEAYWGLLLCKFGVEYVEDPKTFKRIPTCHRTQIESILADADYQSAMEYADVSQKILYEAEAKQIDMLQKDILKTASKEEPFDVFICYKEADENGNRTQDSVIANDIYHQLTQENLKVFYAAITLEDKLGSEYEPYIFAALNSAKVMLVVGSKPEHFHAVWVKNEWSRYLKLLKSDRSKLLIPCYKDMDAYDLPVEFAHLQAQDMSKIGFINDIVRGIKKVIRKPTPVETTPANDIPAAAPVPTENVENLVKRMFLFLEDGEWNSADKHAERVLDLDPESTSAYLGKLMIDLHIKKIEDLPTCSKPLESSKYYSKVLHFAQTGLSEELRTYNASIQARNSAKKKKRKKVIIAVLVAIVLLAAAVLTTIFYIIPNTKYQKAIRQIEDQYYAEGIIALQDLDGFKDSHFVIRKAAVDGILYYLENHDFEHITHILDHVSYNLYFTIPDSYCDWYYEQTLAYFQPEDRSGIGGLVDDLHAILQYYRYLPDTYTRDDMIALLYDAFELYYRYDYPVDCFIENMSLLKRAFANEDVQKILLSDSYIEKFMIGNWYTSDKQYYLKFSKNSDNYTVHSQYNLPRPNESRTYYNIIDLNYVWVDANDTNRVDVYKFDFVDADTVNVYCYADGNTYTLKRVS